MAGLTDRGFETKSFDEIRTELEDSFRTIFGQDINLDSTSLLAQTIGIFTKHLYDLWQTNSDVYQSRFPNSAQGINLDHLVSVAGLERKQEFRSSGVVYLSGAEGTIVPSRTILSTSNGEEVETLDTATIAKGSKPVLRIKKEQGNLTDHFILQISQDFLTLYTEEVGRSATIPYSSSANAVIAEIDNLFQETGTVDSVVVNQDGFTVNFSRERFLPILQAINADIEIITAGLADGVSVGAAAVLPGPKVIKAFEINSITNPPDGLALAFNFEDFIVGRLEETDQELRTRWLNRVEGALISSGTALENTISNIVGVNQVIVSESKGQIEIIVSGGDEQKIANAIFSAKPVGIDLIGDIRIIVFDNNENPKPIFFSRPDLKNIFVKVRITRNADLDPDTESQVRGALSLFADRFSLGGILRPSPDLIWALKGIRGIDQLEITAAETSDGNFTTNFITLGSREKLNLEILSVTIV